MKKSLIPAILFAASLPAQTIDSSPRGLSSVLFANLGTPANGTIVYCSDCTAANPTGSGGAGAEVRRENGAWNGGGAPLTSPAFTGTPTAPTPGQNNNSTTLATTAYTDLAVANALAGVNPAVSVQAASAAVLPNSPTYLNGAAGIGATLTTATTNTALVVDGYTVLLGDRILVKNQASSFQNGVYFLSTLQSLGVAWILTRALDYDQPSDMNSTGLIPVISGTVNAGTQWLQTSKVTTVGTDAVVFTQFSAGLPTAASLVRSCEIVIGDPGAASPVLANDNDSPSVCGNKTGATLTITAVECFADAGSPTVTPIITGGGATSILTGALTCGTGSFATGTLNSVPLETNGQSIDGNITVAGGVAKYIVIRITRTL